MADIDDIINFIDSTFEDIHSEYESITDDELNDANSQTTVNSNIETTEKCAQVTNMTDGLNELKSNIDQDILETSELLQNSSISGTMSNSFKQELQAENDARSVFIGNFHHEIVMEELEAHFLKCGSIVQIYRCLYKSNENSIPFAYIEFADMDSVYAALAMNGSLFQGQKIKVAPKKGCKTGTTNEQFPYKD